MRGPAELALFIPEVRYHRERGNTQVTFIHEFYCNTIQKSMYLWQKRETLTNRLESVQWLQEALHIYFFTSQQKRHSIFCQAEWTFWNPNIYPGITIPKWLYTYIQVILSSLSEWTNLDFKILKGFTSLLLQTSVKSRLQSGKQPLVSVQNQSQKKVTVTVLKVGQSSNSKSIQGGRGKDKGQTNIWPFRWLTWAPPQ